MTSNIFLLIIAYLIGSLPSSVWIGKYFYKIDVREHGSGNAGATNTFRVLGKKAGIPVLILDVLKGWLAVKLSIFSSYTMGTNPFVNLQLTLGISSLLGHIFPIYVGFRGGKGIATLLGILIALHFNAAILSMLIFIILLIIYRYVSLASIIASLLFPFNIICVFATESLSLIIFSVMVAVLVVVTHQKNIVRLFNGEESKVIFFKK